MIIANRDDINQTRRAAAGAGGLVDQYVSRGGLSVVEAEIKAAAKLITGGENIATGAIEGFRRLMGQRDEAANESPAKLVENVNLGSFPNLISPMRQQEADVLFSRFSRNSQSSVSKADLESLMGIQLNNTEARNLSNENFTTMIEALMKTAKLDDHNSNSNQIRLAIEEGVRSALQRLNI